VRILFVGESHTEIAFHRVQLQVIQALQARGRSVLVGLEMFPFTAQAGLDTWNAGKESETEFLSDSHWYLNWGYHWDYYRDIFLFAKAHRIPFFGVNTPRDVITAVRKKGFKDLSPAEAAVIPAKIDTSSVEHRRLFKAYFADDESLMHTMSEQVFEGMYAAQCTWDASMGFNAVKALQKTGKPKSIMVVLIGAGHVAYGLGIQRQTATFFDGRTATLIPTPVEDLKGRNLRTVQASYADYVWGLPREEEPLFPSLGLASRGGRNGEPMTVLDVPKDTPAAAAGFKAGDLLLALDGTPLKDLETYNRLLSGKRWGDAAVLKVKRGTEELTLTALLRRPERKRETGPTSKV
jgi:uncharacterized iron-regulated protein